MAPENRQPSSPHGESLATLLRVLGAEVSLAHSGRTALECVDTFSTLPQYWDYPEEPDEKHLREWAGKPKLLAELWQVPLERIERYFVNWGMEADRKVIACAPLHEVEQIDHPWIQEYFHGPRARAARDAREGN